LGFGRRYARGMGQSHHGPIPPDPREGARYFRPLPVEPEEDALTESGAAQHRRLRLHKPVLLRKAEAFVWVAGRKISRLHRAVPLAVVAVFYLLVAGGLCFWLARPLMNPTPPAEVVPLAPVAPAGLAETVAAITQMIAEKNFPDALAKIEKLETEYPGDARVFMAKGAVYAGQRDYPKALAAFEEAEKLSPGSVAATMNLAEILFVMGRHSEAEALYRKIHAAQKKNTLVIFRLYLCAQLQKSQEDATGFLNNPSIGAQTLEWYYMQAANDLFAGRKTEGLKTIEKARVLFGSKTKPYDKTLARLGLLPERPEE
jgi:cytochrome c-type biogenesis protein CcmH/NrfG